MIYLELLYVFFKIGLLTFGGGYAMIPMIESEAIARGWITNEMLVNFLAISESTPGSFAVNIATFIGNSQGGFLGATCATIGVVLPSFIIILIIFQFYKKFITNKYVIYVMNGLRAVVVGLIASVAIDLVYKELVVVSDGATSFNYVSLILFGVLLTIQLVYRLIFKKQLNSIIFIILSAIVGILTYGVIL